MVLLPYEANAQKPLTTCGLRLLELKRLANVVLESMLTCPEYGHARREVMPGAAGQFYYQCENCRTILRPKPGDCCVFCSYEPVKWGHLH